MGPVVVMALSLETIPLGILLSAAWDHRFQRRRSRFWLRLAGLVMSVMLPELILIAGSAARMFGDHAINTVLWAGFLWGGALAALTPLVLFRRPGPSPGPDDRPDGPDPSDEPPPPRPGDGIPLPDAQQPSFRIRGPHHGRRPAPHRRPPVHKPERGPSRTRPLVSRPRRYPIAQVGGRLA